MGELTFEEGPLAEHLLTVLQALLGQLTGTPPLREGHTLRCAALATDQVVRWVGSAQPTPAHVRGVWVLRPGQSGPPLNRIEPFVLPHLSPEMLSPNALATVVVNRGEPSLSAPLWRLARKCLGRTLGVALGGGAALGIAHLGVLDVLEARGIEIDAVSGSSFGALVAAGVAAGTTAREMTEQLRLELRPRHLLRQLEFRPRPWSLLGGAGFARMTAPLVQGRERFEDLLIPCRFVAADQATGELVEIVEGELRHGYLSSCAVPILLPPYRYRGMALLDGGVADPLPVEVVREMGADLVLAVNVVPALQAGVQNLLAQGFATWSLVRPGSGRQLRERARALREGVHAYRRGLRRFSEPAADLALHPHLEEFTWWDIYKSRQMVERGRDAMQQHLDELELMLKTSPC